MSAISPKSRRKRKRDFSHSFEMTGREKRERDFIPPNTRDGAEVSLRELTASSRKTIRDAKSPQERSGKKKSARSVRSRKTVRDANDANDGWARGYGTTEVVPSRRGGAGADERETGRKAASSRRTPNEECRPPRQESGQAPDRRWKGSGRSAERFLRPEGLSYRRPGLAAWRPGRPRFRQTTASFDRVRSRKTVRDANDVNDGGAGRYVGAPSATLGTSSAPTPGEPFVRHPLEKGEEKDPTVQ